MGYYWDLGLSQRLNYKQLSDKQNSLSQNMFHIISVKYKKNKPNLNLLSSK